MIVKVPDNLLILPKNLETYTRKHQYVYSTLPIVGAKLKSSTLIRETDRTVSREMYTSVDCHAVDLRAISY